MDPDAVKRGMNHCLVAGALLATLGIVTTVTIQIVARLFWTSAPAWTEEAARFFFIFSVAFAAGPALRDGVFVRVDLLARWLPPRGAALLEVLVHLLTGSLLAVMALFSSDFIQLGMDQRSPSLRFPMAVVHSALFLLAATTAGYALAAALGAWHQWREQGPSA